MLIVSLGDTVTPSLGQSLSQQITPTVDSRLRTLRFTMPRVTRQSGTTGCGICTRFLRVNAENHPSQENRCSGLKAQKRERERCQCMHCPSSVLSFLSLFYPKNVTFCPLCSVFLLTWEGGGGGNGNRRPKSRPRSVALPHSPAIKRR